MPVTRINNNQITDSSAGNVYLGVNAAAKVQDFSVTGGKLQNNLTYGSDLTITGNLTVQGNTTTVDTHNLVVEDPLILLAKEQTGSPTLDIGFIGKRGTSDNIAFVWDESADEFVTAFTTSENTNTVITISSYASLKTLDMAVTGNLAVTGTTSFTGNITSLAVTGNIDGGNLRTPGLVTATGNVTGGNINTGGAVSATGNVNSGNVNTGIVSATGNVDSGNVNTGIMTASGNVTGANLVTGGLVSATGNVTGGNVLTGGLISAAGNITSGANVVGGNLTTAGLISATGNLTSGNVNTGIVSATGNVNSGNLTTGIISATGNVNGTGAVFSGNITAANFIGNISGNIDAGGANTQVQFNDDDLLNGSANFTFNKATNTMSVTGTIQGTTVSATGNVIGGNVTTAGLVSATGNVTGGNITTSGNVDATSAFVNAGAVLASGRVEAGTTMSAGGNITSAGNVVATANVIGGNLSTAGVVTATGNVTGGNLLTAGLVSAGGNVQALNVNTGIVSATGNVVGANVSTAGLVTATGNVTGGNVLTGGIVSATGNVSGGNLTTAGLVSAAGNIAGNNISAAGFVSATGNIQSSARVVTPEITTASGDLVLNSAGGALQWDGSGNIVLNSQWINNLADPVAAYDAATKQYVDDAVSTGITIHTPVQLETPTALPAATYAQGGTTATVTDTIAGNTVVFSTAVNPQVNDQLWFTTSFSGIVANTAYFVVSAPNTSAAVLSTQYNGAPVSNISNATGLTQAVRINSGIGATLTGNTNASLTVDGVAVTVSDRILVYNQTPAYENGVYVVTQTGNISAPFILTRSTDTDVYGPKSTTELDVGDYFYVQYGNTGAGESYVMTAPTGPFIIGYDSITFTQFSASQVYSANTAAGLVLNGTTFSAKVDNDTTAFDGGGNIIVKAGANLTTPNIGAATGTSLSVTANVTGGNILTGGLISATGNITGGNLISGNAVIGNINVSGDITVNSITSNTYVSAVGNLVSANVNTGIVSASGNVLSGGVVSATGNVTGGNILTAGLMSAAGNITSGSNVEATANVIGGNISTTGIVTATGNVTGGNVATGGLVTATGNVTGGNLITGGLITATGNINTSANLVATANVIGGNISTTGLITATGNVTSGNVNTGIVSATGNVNSGNLTTGIISATGNVNGTGAVFSGNVSAANFIGNISGNIDAGGANTQVQFNDGDLLAGSANFTFDKATNFMSVTGTIQGTTVCATGTVTGAYVYSSGELSAAGNVVAANVFTAGQASATGNVTGGNLVTAGLATVTGNVTGGNLLTAGLISAGGNITSGANVVATANVTGGNLSTAGLITATGNITGANVILTSGTIDGPAAGRITINASDLDTDFAVDGDTVPNIFYVDAGTGTASFGNSLQTTGAIVSFQANNSILMPVGNTAQRPTGVLGMLRFNSTGDSLEVYTSGGWEDVGVPAFTVITADSFSGNGAQTVFTLSQDSTTAATIVSINGVVQIPTTAYSVSGNTLTFTEAPAVSDTIDARLLTTTTTVTALENVSGNAIVETLDTAATVQITGDLLPAANITYNLGSPTRMWQNAYFAGNTIFLGNLQLKQVDANTFAVFTADGVTQANIDVGSIDVTSIVSGTTTIGIGAPNGNAFMAPAGSNALVAASTGVFVTGLLSATGNITGNYILGNGSLLTGIDATSIQSGTSNVRVVSSGGNVTVGVGGTGNVSVFSTVGQDVTGRISATGNITGNFIFGNGSQLTGIDATSIQSGTSNVRVVSSGGNVTVGIGGTGNVVVVATTGAVITGIASVTGNVTGGNLLTGGLISATGNVNGGNLIAATLVQGTTVSATGNVVAGNVTTVGLISATGNITGGNLSGTNIVGTLTTAAQPNITSVGTLTSLNSGTISSSGNVTGANILTGGLISATGSITTGADISLAGNIVDTGALVISTSSNGNITLSPNGTGVIIASKDLLNGQANGVGNIGNATGYFNTIFAKATSAQYADLAEMYEADGAIEPGTVVAFGGSKEVTTCGDDSSRRIAGVVSTNPSYIMNAGLAGDHVVAVALTGRVPTRVTGSIRKGDMLVSAGAGRARAESNPAVGAVIGKALADFDGAEGTIEVVVGRL